MDCKLTAPSSGHFTQVKNICETMPNNIQTNLDNVETTSDISEFRQLTKQKLSESLIQLSPTKGENGKLADEKPYGNNKHFRANGTDFSADTSGTTSTSSVHSPMMPFRPSLNSSFIAAPVDIDNAMANLHVDTEHYEHPLEKRQPQVDSKSKSYNLSQRTRILPPLNTDLTEQWNRPGRAKYLSESSDMDESVNNEQLPQTLQMSSVPSPKEVTYFHIIQQLLFDGHTEIGKQLLLKAPISVPVLNSLVASDNLEKMIIYVLHDYQNMIFHQTTSSSLRHLPDSTTPTGAVAYEPSGDVSSEYGDVTNSATIFPLSGVLMHPPPPNQINEEFDDDEESCLSNNEEIFSSLPLSANLSEVKSDLKIVCKFGSVGNGPGQLNMPHGFCIGVNDNVVIADTNNHRISIFDLSGDFLFCFGDRGTNDGQLYLPRKVAMLPPNVISAQDQEPVFVVCDRGAKRSRMQIFSIRGQFIRGIPIVYMDIVSGLCTTQDRKIVVVDSVRSGVSILNEFGVLLYWFTCASEMIEPSDVTVHEQDYYICDFKGHCVNVFNQHGVLIRKIGSQTAKFPNGIDISDMGDIVVGDSHGNRFHVTLFSSKGQLLGDFDCPYLKVSRCCGLKITSKGMIVTLAKNNNHVLVLNTINVLQNQA